MNWVHFIFHNFWWKVLALGIAIVLWALVANEPELSTFATVRVEYKNLPEDLEISSMEPVGTVTLELRGPSGELRGLGDGGIRPDVVLDMSGVTPGQRTFTISSRNVHLSRGVVLVRAIPSEERVTFERHLTRTVPVKARFTGVGVNGYVVARDEVEPKELSIAGPASRVEAIKEVTTDPVDVSNAVGSSEYHVNAFVSDPYVRFQSSPQVTVAVTMKKK
jgi:YbbR domain-containing protein